MFRAYLNHNHLELAFHCRLWFLLFSACRHLPRYYFFSFFAIFISAYMDPTCFVKRSSLLLFSLRSAHRLAF